MAFVIQKIPEMKKLLFPIREEENKSVPFFAKEKLGPNKSALFSQDLAQASLGRVGMGRILCCTMALALAVLAHGQNNSAVAQGNPDTLVQPSNEKKSLPNVGIATQEREKPMSEKSLELNGKGLRRAIENKYEEMVRTKSFKPRGQGRNAIDDVVLEYIPIGTSFDDAEAILRSAGFEVGPRGAGRIYKNTYEVSATISFFREIFLGRVDVYLRLYPRNKDDWTEVQAVEAGFIKDTL
jgi:hypothetical protein